MPNNLIDAMNNVSSLSTPVFVRLNTVADVVMVAVALQIHGNAAKKHGENGIAARAETLVDQIMSNTPDDWDCGDPTCESCAQHRDAGDGLKRARLFEPTVEFIIDPEGGEA